MGYQGTSCHVFTSWTLSRNMERKKRLMNSRCVDAVRFAGGRGEEVFYVCYFDFRFRSSFIHISSMLYVNGRNEKQPEFRRNEFWVFLFGRLQVFGSHSSLAINPS